MGFIITALPMKASTAVGGTSVKERYKLFIVDQHASDEKFRFENLNRASKVDRQPLVSPHHLQLSPAQEQLAVSNLEVFRLNGFELKHDPERPPGRRLSLVTLPTCQGMVFSEKDLTDLLFTLEEAETDSTQASLKDTSARKEGLLDLSSHRALWSATAVPRPPKIWKLLACRACRSAIMIGKGLKKSEMEKVISNLASLQHPWNCPHGRPTMRHLADTTAARDAPRNIKPLSEGLGTRPPVPAACGGS